jgi:AraC family transcriptional regulator
VNAWNEFQQTMKAQGLKGTGDPWEVYVTDPGDEPDPSKWQTELVYPIEG